MKQLSLLLCAAITLSACQTTVKSSPDGRFANLPVTNQLHATGPFRDLARLEPMYPVEEARGGGEGCATINNTVITRPAHLDQLLRKDLAVGSKAW